MKEEVLNIFDVIGENCGICIPTNGIVKRNGEAVMGAGLAKAFNLKWPGIAMAVGKAIEKNGNVVSIIGSSSGMGWHPNTGVSRTIIFSFPTKNHWKDKSDINLIEKSTRTLVAMIDALDSVQLAPKTVYLPRPGCGMGGLTWGSVRERIAPLLDDRFIVVNDS